MKYFTNYSKAYLITSNVALLFFTLFTIFLIPFFPIELHKTLFSISFTAIFLLSALALEKNRGKIFNIAVLVVIIEWLSEILNIEYLSQLSLLINIIFFDLLVILFIYQIARAQTVTPQVIMESINGYLMLGLSFSILIALISTFDQRAFSFPHLTENAVQNISQFSNYTYYGFVTLTTLGYGDVVPHSSAAKSLSILIAITGQMYIAIIIAALVAKYLNQSKSKQK